MYNVILCFLLLLTISILGCTSSTPRQIALGNQIMINFSKKMEQENDLVLFGMGYGGSLSGNLRTLGVRFRTEQKADIQQARNLLILTCEKFLDDVNANEEIRSWLTEYPYTGQNLNMTIGFEKTPFKDVDPPYIALAAVWEGKVCYSIFENGRLNTIHHETYEEALKIYQEECLRQLNTQGIFTKNI